MVDQSKASEMVLSEAFEMFTIRSSIVKVQLVVLLPMRHVGRIEWVYVQNKDM